MASEASGNAFFWQFFLSTIIPLTGFWIVHRLTVQRQKRDEFFKIMGVLIENIHETAEFAHDLWKKPGSDPDVQKVTTRLIPAVGRIGRIVKVLGDRKGDLGVGAEMLAFRKACTLDIEDTTRPLDSVAATSVLERAIMLEMAIHAAFLRLYK